MGQHVMLINKCNRGIDHVLFFQIPRSSSKRKYVGDDSGQLMEENLSQLSSRFKNMLRTAYSCGDNERVMQGLFENYLEVKFKVKALFLCAHFIVVQEGK